MTGLSDFDSAAYNNSASNAAQVHSTLLLFFCSDLKIKTFPELIPNPFVYVTPKWGQLMDCCGHWVIYLFIFLNKT